MDLSLIVRAETYKLIYIYIYVYIIYLSFSWLAIIPRLDEDSQHEQGLS